MDQYLQTPEYSASLICVDSYGDGVPAGRFYSGDGERTFSCMVHLLRAMEDALADAATAHWVEEIPETSQRGRMASFLVRISFCQNSTWQGSLTWLEIGQEERFRSALELVFLMDKALRG